MVDVDSMPGGNQAPSLGSVFSLRKPKDFKAGLASGGKSVLKGVGAGVVGLFAAPALGAIEEGAIGFAKGLGTGNSCRRKHLGIVVNRAFQRVKKLT